MAALQKRIQRNAIAVSNNSVATHAPVIGYPRNGASVLTNFIASGTAPGASAPLTLSLTPDPGSACRIIALLQPSSSNPNWIFMVNHVPIGNGYTLTLMDSTNAVLCASKHIHVHKAHGYGSSGFGITWPPTGMGDICEECFVPFGSCDNGDPTIKATMTSDSGDITNADGISIGSIWYAPFPALTEGNYILNVTQNGGSPAMSQDLGLNPCDS
jgi:hypothetical protein